MLCRHKRLLLLLAFAGALFYLIFGRDIPTAPDRPPEPGPVEPVKSPVDEFRRPWTSAAAANWKVTEYLAALSLSAYDGLPSTRAAATALGFQGIERIQKGTMMADVVWADDVLVVAFRGTDFNEIEDWIVDLNALVPEPTDLGGVHAGFSQAYATMRDDVRRLLREHHPTYTWVTGHSLGGALAVVCASDLNSVNSDHPFGVITFGQPMVATAELANHLHGPLGGRFVHFANREDPVPRLPPFIYRHFGSLALFTSGRVERRWDVYWAKPGQQPPAGQPAERNDIPAMPPDELRRLQDQIRREKAARRAAPGGKAQATVPSLAAHHMQLYLENVRQFVVGKGVPAP